MTGFVVAGSSLGPADAADAPASPAGASAAMRIYVDPATGKPAPPSEVSERPAPAPSAEAVVEEPAPGGGTMVRLPDSYKRPLEVTVGPDGVPHVGHAAPSTTR